MFVIDGVKVGSILVDDEDEADEVKAEPAQAEPAKTAAPAKPKGGQQ